MFVASQSVLSSFYKIKNINTKTLIEINSIWRWRKTKYVPEIQMVLEFDYMLRIEQFHSRKDEKHVPKGLQSWMLHKSDLQQLSYRDEQPSKAKHA